MQRFCKSQRPGEMRFGLFSLVTEDLGFYVDPARPTQVRYERIEPRD